MLAAGVKGLPWIVGFEDRQFVLSEAITDESVRKMTTLKIQDVRDDAEEATLQAMKDAGAAPDDFNPLDQPRPQPVNVAPDQIEQPNAQATEVPRPQPV